MAWTSLSFAYGSVLTSTKITQLYDNITAFANKDSGAPVLASAYVTQSMLKTTTAAGSVVSNITTGKATYTLSGGTYSWWTASGQDDQTFAFDSGNTSTGVIGLKGGPNSTFYVDERYVQASPPYSLGPLFVFLAISKNGDIKNIQVAPDPPWAYHGPTDIAPHYERNGKKFRKEILISGKTIKQHAYEKADVAKLVNEVNPVEIEIEIDLDYKDRDIGIIPHPFTNLMNDDRVILIEPGTIMMERFFDFCNCGEAREVRELFVGGGIKINNTKIDRFGPPGVDIVSAKWKNTK